MRNALVVVAAAGAIGYVWYQSKLAAETAAQVPTMLAQQVALAQAGSASDPNASASTSYAVYGPADPTPYLQPAAPFASRFFLGSN